MTKTKKYKTELRELDINTIEKHQKAWINACIKENFINSFKDYLISKNILKERINFERINNDINGNPRYVIHFLNLDSCYERALKKAKNLGGRKFDNKSYGGGIVFQSYNLDSLEQKIFELHDIA